MLKSKSRLANKLSFFIAILLLAVFLLISVFCFRILFTQTQQNLLKQVALQEKAISSEIVHIFENARQYTHQMSLNRDITTYLKGVDSKDEIRTHENYPYVLDYLTKIKESSPLHFLAWVANEKANFYLDNSNTVPDESYVVKDRPWYEVALSSDKPVFTNPYVEWNTRKTVVSSIQALREDTKVYGFVVVDIMLDTIPGIIESRTLDFNDKTFLITSDGTYLYHPDKQKIMTETIYDDGLYEAMKTSTFKDFFEEIKYNDASYFMSSYTIGENGWQLISLIDSNRIKKEIIKTFTTLVFIVLLFFLLAIISIYFIVSKTTKPYSILSIFADDIANGDFSKNIPENFLKRKDEMGVISISFQRIIDAFRDENQSLEEKITEKNRELEEQYEYIFQTEKAASLGNLVAGVAHEINTPLGIGVSTASHISQLNNTVLQKLNESTMTKEDLKSFMINLGDSSKLLESNLHRASELIKSFKQIAVDQISEAKTTFLLKDNINSVIISLGPKYKSEGHTIALDCPMDIELSSYPGVYSQIFTNLIINSIEHGFKNKKNGKISIACTKDENYLYIHYEDNGIGISSENLKQIYEPFFTTNRQNGNSGLGMNIVFNLVNQKLKGTMSAQSTPLEFTSFDFKIPI